MLKIGILSENDMMLNIGRMTTMNYKIKLESKDESISNSATSR